MKFKIFTLIIFFIPLLFLEISLRLMSNKKGHIELFLNKPWYVIPPIDIPQINFEKDQINHNKYRIYDELLGWTIGKRGIDLPLYFSNSEGSRITETEYNLNAEVPKKVDVVTIGDSFTHGDEVKCEDSWPHMLGKKLNKTIINKGVGGYGIDQAVLSYMYSNVESDYALLGIIAGDFERSTNILYKGLYFGGTKSKPMFYFADNTFKIINQPALTGDKLLEEFMIKDKSSFFKNGKSYHNKIIKRDFFDISYIYRFLKMFWLHPKVIKSPIYLKDNDQLENYLYNLEIIKVFKNLALEKNSKPIIIILGNNNSFNDRSKVLNPWGKFKDDLYDLSIPYIDTSDSLFNYYKNNPDLIINSFGVHYTPFANKIVSDIIYNNIY